MVAAHARWHRRVGGAAARARHGVEVDVVGHGVAGRVREREAQDVADAGTDHRPGRAGDDLVVALARR